MYILRGQTKGIIVFSEVAYPILHGSASFGDVTLPHSHGILLNHTVFFSRLENSTNALFSFLVKTRP